MAELNTLLGFDFGLKNIGIAVGQTITGTANPVVTLKAKNGEPNWAEVEALIQKWRPDALLIGVPLNMDGTDQPITAAAKDFIKKLEDRFNIPTYSVDERLTTKAAKEIVFEEGGYKALQSGKVDQVAAKLMLEQWMQENK